MLSYSIWIPYQNKKLHTTVVYILVVIAILVSATAVASEIRELVIHPATSDPRAIFCVIIFILSYLLVMTEEATSLRKSKPVMLAAGILWAAIGYMSPVHDYPLNSKFKKLPGNNEGGAVTGLSKKLIQ